MSIAPFYVGQEVVANCDHPQGAFKKGDEFIVTSVFNGCCGWLVTVGIVGRRGTSRCLICGNVRHQGREWIMRSSRFSPKIEISEFISMKEIANVELFAAN